MDTQRMIFCLLVAAIISPVFTEEWRASVVKELDALVTSCVVVPCSFTHPKDSLILPTSRLRGIWHRSTDRNQRIYYEDSMQVLENFRGRTKLLGHLDAPVNVTVEHKSDVKEGEAVRLRCSSDAHPPTSSYQWHNETGAQLHQGNVYMLPNVSRHTGALYCTAINAVGQGNSSPVQLNVLYAPEIKTASSCSSEADMVKCVCIVESKLPSIVYFVLSDRVLPSTEVEKHGFVTIGTLRAKFGSSEAVYCLANNTQ
ncbi:hypothetical protein EPR50_G00066400 [Perca flavescens]|uniref:Ig-like domain-containing protein n=1 Tax=Perca flavescens TaxID=8167 RepID=A0A484D9T7_PERFV|nr:hypothetical protein EPR50_G00066400 [Perca flavescens]